MVRFCAPRALGMFISTTLFHSHPSCMENTRARVGQRFSCIQGRQGARARVCVLVHLLCWLMLAHTDISPNLTLLLELPLRRQWLCVKVTKERHYFPKKLQLKPSERKYEFISQHNFYVYCSCDPQGEIYESDHFQAFKELRKRQPTKSAVLGQFVSLQFNALYKHSNRSVFLKFKKEHCHDKTLK